MRYLPSESLFVIGFIIDPSTQVDLHGLWARKFYPRISGRMLSLSRRFGIDRWKFAIGSFRLGSSNHVSSWKKIFRRTGLLCFPLLPSCEEAKSQEWPRSLTSVGSVSQLSRRIGHTDFTATVQLQLDRIASLGPRTC